MEKTVGFHRLGVLKIPATCGGFQYEAVSSLSLTTMYVVEVGVEISKIRAGLLWAVVRSPSAVITDE